MGTTSSTPAQPVEADVDAPEPHVTEPHAEFDRHETSFEPQQQIIEAQKRGWIAVAGVMYENAVKAIIRPPRDIYASKELGPTEFRFRGRRFVRKDFILRNPRNMAIQCSHWMPSDEDRPSPRIPCVVCLHGNSSSRVSAKFNLEVVLNEGASLLAIDFAGSGRSDGRWVTLGWWEKDDLATVLEHVRSEGRTSSVALWGRSMGAATSLLHCPRDPLIDGMILDSPFADLQQLIEEIVERFRSQAGVTAPSWVTGTVIRMVQNSVFKRTGMDILRLKPASTAYLCHVRALITAGRDDSFVAPHHATAIYEEYCGAKELVLLDGQDHNSQRPRWFQDRAGIFLRQALHIPDELPLYREFGFDSLPETLGVAWTRAIRAGSVSHRPPPGHTVVGLEGSGKPAGPAAATTGGTGTSTAAAAATAATATAAVTGAAGPEGGLDEELSGGGDSPDAMGEPFDPVAFAIEQSKVTAVQDELRRQLAASEAAASAGGATRQHNGEAAGGASGDGKGALTAGKPRTTQPQAPQPWLMRRASSSAAVSLAAPNSERDVRASDRVLPDFGHLRTVDSASPPLPDEDEDEDDELQQAIRKSLEEAQPRLPGNTSDAPDSPRGAEERVPHGSAVADEAAIAAEAAAAAANLADADSA